MTGDCEYMPANMNVYRRQFIVASASIVALAGCVEDDGILNGDGDAAEGATPGLLDSVPADPELLVGIDAAVRTEPEAREILDAYFQTVADESFEEFETELEDERDIDIAAVDGVLGYAVDLEAARHELYTILIQADWNKDDFESVIKELGDVELEPSDYAGEDGVLWEETEEIDGPVEAAAGILPDGVFAIGVREGVTAALDVAYDDGETLSEEMRDRFSDAGGDLTVVSRVFEDEIPPDFEEQDISFSAFEDATFLVGSVGASEGEVSAEATITFIDDEGAAAAHENLEELHELWSDPEFVGDMADLVEEVELSLETESVSARISVEPERLVEVIEMFTEPAEDDDDDIDDVAVDDESA